jgi:hypothetical protein
MDVGTPAALDLLSHCVGQIFSSQKEDADSQFMQIVLPLEFHGETEESARVSENHGAACLFYGGK